MRVTPTPSITSKGTFIRVVALSGVWNPAEIDARGKERETENMRDVEPV